MQTSDNVLIEPIHELCKDNYDFFGLYTEMASMTIEDSSGIINLPITYAEYNLVLNVEQYSAPFCRMTDMKRIMALMDPKNGKWRTSVVIDNRDVLDYKELGRYIREVGGYPYLRKLDKGNLVHHNFIIGDNMEYFIPKELEDEFNIIIGVLHNAYLLSLEADDYKEDIEIPWYYIDWQIIALHASDIATQLLIECNHCGYSSTIEKSRDETINYRTSIKYPFIGRSTLIDALASIPPYPRRIYTYTSRIHTIQVYYDEGRVYSDIPNIYVLMEKLAAFLPNVLDGQLRPIDTGLCEIMGFEEVLNSEFNDFRTAVEKRTYATRLFYSSPEELVGIFVNDIVRTNRDNYLEVIFNTLGSSIYMSLVSLMYKWYTVIANNYYREGMSIDAGEPDAEEVKWLLNDYGLKTYIEPYTLGTHTSLIIKLERITDPSSLCDVLQEPDNDDPLPDLTKEQEAEIYENDEEFRRVADYLTNALDLIDKHNSNE